MSSTAAAWRQDKSGRPVAPAVALARERYYGSGWAQLAAARRSYLDLVERPHQLPLITAMCRGETDTPEMAEHARIVAGSRALYSAIAAAIDERSGGRVRAAVRARRQPEVPSPEVLRGMVAGALRQSILDLVNRGDRAAISLFVRKSVRDTLDYLQEQRTRDE